MKENEMDGACSTHGREEKLSTKFCFNNLKERDHLEDLSVDANNNTEWVLWVLEE